MATKSVSSPAEFERLVKARLGEDLADYYHSQLEQLSSCIRDLVRYIDEPSLADEMEEVIKENGF